MRSFDQYGVSNSQWQSLTVAANIVLEETVERIFVGNKYCEKPLGIFIIRGENVVLLSEIVCVGFSVTKKKDLSKEASAASERWEATPQPALMSLFNEAKEKKEEALKLRKQIRMEHGYDPDEG